MHSRSPRALKDKASAPVADAKVYRLEIVRLVERIAKIVQENKSGAKKAAKIIERWISNKN